MISYAIWSKRYDEFIHPLDNLFTTRKQPLLYSTLNEAVVELRNFNKFNKGLYTDWDATIKPIKFEMLE